MLSLGSSWCRRMHSFKWPSDDKGIDFVCATCGSDAVTCDITQEVKDHSDDIVGCTSELHTNWSHLRLYTFVKSEKFVFTPGLCFCSSGLGFGISRTERFCIYLVIGQILWGSLVYKEQRKLAFFSIGRLNGKRKLWGTAGRGGEGVQTLVQHIVEGILYKDVQISHLLTEEIVWAEGAYRQRAGVALDLLPAESGTAFTESRVFAELRCDDAFGFHCLFVRSSHMAVWIHGNSHKPDYE